MGILTAYPLRYLIPGLLLGTSLLLAMLYVQHRYTASDTLIESHLGREASYIGPQITADFIEAHQAAGLRGGLRKLIRHATRPDIRLTLVIAPNGELIFINKPDLQGRPLEMLPDPPPRTQVEAARISLEGMNWLSPGGLTLWGLFPVELEAPVTPGVANPNNLVLALAYDAAMAKSVERERILDEIAIFLAWILFISCLIWLLLRQAVTHRIEQLAEAAHHFVEGRGGFTDDIQGHDEIGRLAHDLASIGRDLHERYRQIESANAELAKEIVARREAENELRLTASVFASTSEGIIITDLKNRIIEVNDAFVHVTGYSREEIIGKTPSLLHSGSHDQAFYSAMWGRIKSEGRWKGEVRNRRKNGEIYTEILDIGVVSNESGEVTHYVGVFTDISELKETQARLEKMAHYDHLTGLPNRTLFVSRLEEAMAGSERSGNLLAVALLDLDHFKPVNDTHGHEMGDRLLIQIAQRLDGCMRTGDIVARIGGDEFVLLIQSLTDAASLWPLLQRIQASFETPVHIDGHTFDVTGSLGATIYPSDPGDADTLLRHADQAMYLAKQAGRNRFHLFDPVQDHQIHQHYEVIEKMRHALMANQFEVYYQPKLCMSGMHVYGAEALVRWNDPERGIVMPGEFLPHAENHDVIVALDQWVLDDVLRQQSIWRAAGIELVLSVNIAARDLQREDFVDRLRTSLQRYPELPAGCLELEILESAALQNMRHIRQVIETCRGMGVSFSLDDFGAGYASLAYLKEIPVDTLKIDQGFVRDILEDRGDLALVHGVVGLAQAFNLKVIAEGVETPEHGVLLMRLGCENVQGYGIARPMPVARFEVWLESAHFDEAWQAWVGSYWSADDYPLLMAQRDHLDWISKLIGCVEGIQPAENACEFSDTCRLGHWYETVGKSRYSHMHAYQELGSIHTEVHRLGTEILDAIKAGRNEEARRQIPQLLLMKDAVINSLSLLQRAVDTYPRVDRKQTDSTEP
jgi:diguanylate cyclase (GGDEF)-like protein/PAS domain S-box-containing protein